MTDMDDGTAVVILLVEDETLVRLLANDILSEAGYRVLEARDGQEAVTILEVHDSIRAILTDVTMPNVDGLALAKIVSGRWPHIGIVFPRPWPFRPTCRKALGSFASPTRPKRSWRSLKPSSRRRPTSQQAQHLSL